MGPGAVREGGDRVHAGGGSAEGEKPGHASQGAGPALSATRDGGSSRLGDVHRGSESRPGSIARASCRRKAPRIVFSIALLHGQGGPGDLGRTKRASILCEEGDEAASGDGGVRGRIRGRSRRDNLRPKLSRSDRSGRRRRETPRPSHRPRAQARKLRARVTSTGAVGRLVWVAEVGSDVSRCGESRI